MGLTGIAIMPSTFGGGDDLDISVSYPLTLQVNGNSRRNPLVRLTEGDVGVSIDFTIQDRDGDAIDITGITVTFKMAKERATSNKVSSACTLTTPTSGQCTYTFAAADLDTAGNYRAELELNFGAGVIKTSERFRITVLKDAPYGS